MVKMSRKNFRVIAERISQISDHEERRESAEHTARALAKSNPRCDKKRFLEACNLEQN